MRFAILAAAVCSLALAQPPSERTGPRGAINGHLTWFDRQGKIAGTVGDVGVYRTLSLSPDGKRVAAERTDPATQNPATQNPATQNKDIWIFDVSTGAGTRFTSNPAWEAFPTWSPDGTRLIFTSNRSGVYDLYEKASNGEGAEKLVYASMEGKAANSWSPDGRFLIYYSIGQNIRLRLLAVDGPADRKPVPLVDPKFTSVTGRFSPDGRWIAYTSNESGKNEVDVRPFDPVTGTAGDPIVVTNGGGRTPLWRGDGKELYYIAPDGMATAMEVTTGAKFQAGAPKPLFKVPDGLLFWDVSPDGSRFLMPAPSR